MSKNKRETATVGERQKVAPLTKDDILKAHKASLSQTLDNFTGIPFKLPFGIDKDLVRKYR